MDGATPSPTTDPTESALDDDRGCVLVWAPGLRAALRSAGVGTDPVERRPLALLDEQGELLAILSLVPLDDRGSAP
jgi:hypothetical protein